MITSRLITEIEKTIMVDILLDGRQAWDSTIIVDLRNTYIVKNNKDLLSVLQNIIAKGLVQVVNSMNDSEGKLVCKYKSNFTL